MSDRITIPNNYSVAVACRDEILFCSNNINSTNILLSVEDFFCIDYTTFTRMEYKGSNFCNIEKLLNLYGNIRSLTINSKSPMIGCFNSINKFQLKELSIFTVMDQITWNNITEFTELEYLHVIDNSIYKWPKCNNITCYGPNKVPNVETVRLIYPDKEIELQNNNKTVILEKSESTVTINHNIDELFLTDGSYTLQGNGYIKQLSLDNAVVSTTLNITTIIVNASGLLPELPKCENLVIRGFARWNPDALPMTNVLYHSDHSK